MRRTEGRSTSFLSGSLSPGTILKHFLTSCSQQAYEPYFIHEEPRDPEVLEHSQAVGSGGTSLRFESRLDWLQSSFSKLFKLDALKLCAHPASAAGVPESVVYLVRGLGAS